MPKLTPQPQPARWADRQDMPLAVGNQRVCTLNALSAALQLSVAVNVTGAVLLFVVRRLVRLAW